MAHATWSPTKYYEMQMSCSSQRGVASTKCGIVASLHLSGFMDVMDAISCDSLDVCEGDTFFSGLKMRPGPHRWETLSTDGLDGALPASEGE
mmetsp:Transcript_3613/g.7336  ORF Transcript_3613/g.7336 Transcript_3613/m.7336 type:complete len:92 (-) Transcript_3613:186-461(-)